MPNILLELNKTYTFNTLAPAILGTQLKNAKLLAMFDYSTAVKYDNVDLKFRQIYPALPAGTPDQPESCIYYLFKSESDEKVVFADQWIDHTTIEVIEHIHFQVSFTDASILDMSRVRDALNALGYRNYTMKQL